MNFQVEILASRVGARDGIIKVSTSFLEEYFDVSREAIRKWEQRGCPKLGRGSWDFIEVLKWRGGLTATNEEEEESEKNAYLRKIKADAFLKEQQGSIAEIELNKLRGLVIETQEIERVIGGIIQNTKGLLLALPSKAAPKLLGISMLGDLRDIIHERGEAVMKVKTHKDVKKLIDEVTNEFCEAKSLVEINDVLSTLIHEALVELSEMSVDLFEGDGHEKEDGEFIKTFAGAVEAAGENQGVAVGGQKPDASK